MEIDDLITPDYRQLSNNFTAILAHRLHYFEISDKVIFDNLSYREIIEMQEGAIKRYQTESIFHARVDSIVAELMQSIQSDHDQRLKEFGGDTGLFKIVGV